MGGVLFPEFFGYITPSSADGRVIADRIEELYDVVDQSKYNDIGTYCQSLSIEVHERYIGVEAVMRKGIGYTLLVALLIVGVLVWDLWATLILIFVDLISVIQ